MVYIYILIDPITKDVKYCGKTNDIKVRLSDHLKNKKYNKEKIEWIYSLKNKRLKPILDVIDIVDDEDWDFWEKYWISQLKTWNFKLFNKTNGGEYSVTGFKHTEEAKKKISEAQFGRKLTKEWRKNISLGRKGVKFSNEHLKNLSLSHIGNIPSNTKSIYQINIKNGDIIEEFDNITEAYKKLEVSVKNSLISKVCKGKVKSAYGYYWCYSDDYKNFKYKKYYRIYNPILQFDKNGKLVNEYSNITLAAKDNNLEQTSISHALNDDPSHGGYIWFHKDKFDKKTLKDKLKRIKREYKLYQLDLETNDVINEFRSIKEAEEKTNIKHISCVLAGKRNHAGGFKWKKEIL
jgi:group I intron endonuclease